MTSAFAAVGSPRVGDAPTAPSSGETTILVIDDDPAMGRMMEILGREHGFAVRTALDGVEGLRLAEEADCDLIVLDLNLPRMTGLDVCRRLRSQGVEVPIVIVSSNTDVVDVVVGLEIGGDDYVTKPFELRELAARISAQLRRQRRGHAQVRPGRLNRGHQTEEDPGNERQSQCK